MRPQLRSRVKKICEATTPPPLLIHQEPGQTKAEAIAAHERTHGAIPPDVEVIVIVHSFTSRI